MSWASRRRTTYLTGVILFFLIVIGGPIAYHILSIAPTCTDGIQNHGETAIDKGGPCPLLDPHALQPHAILWARAFRIRDGSYTAAAYIQNPNDNAGVRTAYYRFGLYDAQNILVAERKGATYIMPGGITPILEARINTGNRIVAHTYFCFTDSAGNCDSSGEGLTWERLKNGASAIIINNKATSDTDTAPRLTATAENSSVADSINLSFIAVVFDPAGNAFAASASAIARLPAGASSPIVFTWPDPFPTQIGRIDIIPSAQPQSTGL